MVLLCTFYGAKAEDLTRVMVVKVTHDTSDVLMPAYKIEAGVALALQLTSNYTVLPTDARDSILLERGLTGLTALQAAEQLQAQELLYVNTRRFENLVRTEIVVLSGGNFEVTNRGVGYSAIRFHNDSTNVAVADPAILLSAQRAVMDAKRNADLYMRSDSIFRVRPAPVVVVGGIDFVLNADTTKTPAWSLFKEQEVTSYDAVQTIAEIISAVDSITLVDIETRDTMLARANLMMVTNNHPTTSDELKVFYAFGITWVISGICTFTADAFTLQLSATTFGKGKSEPLASVERQYNTDTKVAWRNAIVEVAELLVKALPAYR